MRSRIRPPAESARPRRRPVNPPDATARRGATAPRGRRADRAPTPTATAALSPEVNAVLAQFRVIFRSVRQHNRYIEERSGVGAMQLRALAMVDARPGIGVTELATALLIHQPTASKLVESLVESGLLQRLRRVDDARFVELRIAEPARKLLDNAPAPVLGVLPDGLGSLSPEALRRLRRSLDDLMASMKWRDDAARFEPLTEST